MRDLGRTSEALAVCDRLADKPAALLQAALLANRTDVRLPADSATEQAAAATAALFAICEAVLRGDPVDASRLTSILAGGEPGFALDRRWDITDTIECVARARPEHAAFITECYAAATGRSV